MSGVGALLGSDDANWIYQTFSYTQWFPERCEARCAVAPESFSALLRLQGAISVDNPRADDVRSLLAAHLAFAKQQSPPEDVHALDVSGLPDPAVTFFTFRLNERLLGVGALKRLDDHHAELKSMHTEAVARRRGSVERWSATSSALRVIAASGG